MMRGGWRRGNECSRERRNDKASRRRESQSTRLAVAAVVRLDRCAGAHHVGFATSARADNHSKTTQSYVLGVRVNFTQKHRKNEPLFDLGGHGHESLLDVGGVLGRRLEERNAEPVGKLLRHCVIDDALRRQIALVAHQQLIHVFTRISKVVYV
jgi:hypothetical protein